MDFKLVKRTVCVETPNNKMCHTVVLSHTHLLIISTDFLTLEQTEQFCLYCPKTYGGHSYLIWTNCASVERLKTLASMFDHCFEQL